jgi:hypothetical protein
MSDANKLDILVVGGSQVGKNALLMRVLGVQDAPRQPSYSWTIDNKYYTATTNLGAVHVDDLAARPKTQPEWDAVILVFDIERQDTFEVQVHKFVRHRFQIVITLLDEMVFVKNLMHVFPPLSLPFCGAGVESLGRCC